MFDEYLLRYMFEYLRRCKKCNRFDLANKGKDVVFVMIIFAKNVKKLL